MRSGPIRYAGPVYFMTNLEKLKSEICGYLDSCSVLNKQGLHKFIDTLPFELFVKEKAGYLIYVQPAESDRSSFIEFLISCGFGSESVFWSCAKREGSGFLFDTSANMLCEFVVKDGLKRRYSIVLDEIPLDQNNTKHVILNDISTAHYKVTFTFDANIEDEVDSESSNSASYDYNYKIQGKNLYDLLGITNRDVVIDLQTVRRDIPRVSGQVSQGKYAITYPIHCKTTIFLESEDSDKYTLLRKALEVFTKNITCPEVSITKHTLEQINKWENA